MHSWLHVSVLHIYLPLLTHTLSISCRTPSCKTVVQAPSARIFYYMFHSILRLYPSNIYFNILSIIILLLLLLQFLLLQLLLLLLTFTHFRQPSLKPLPLYVLLDHRLLLRHLRPRQLTKQKPTAVLVLHQILLVSRNVVLRLHSPPVRFRFQVGFEVLKGGLHLVTGDVALDLAVGEEGKMRVFGDELLEGGRFGLFDLLRFGGTLGLDSDLHLQQCDYKYYKSRGR